MRENDLDLVAELPSKSLADILAVAREQNVGTSSHFAKPYISAHQVQTRRQNVSEGTDGESLLAAVPVSSPSEDAPVYYAEQMLSMTEEFAGVILEELKQSSRWRGVVLPPDTTASIVAQVATTFAGDEEIMYTKSQARKLMEAVVILCNKAYASAAAP